MLTWRKVASCPAETQEGRYYDRLCQADPIHPEVFDRLYEDWTTIDGFQRTRGVLKLMAKVIARLWKDHNQDLMILPGSLPLIDGDVRNEMTYLLPPGWDPVIEGDIDGDRAETTELEAKEPRFGQVNAARRLARTLFPGTAPSSGATKPGFRGQDRGRVLLGCLQPGQTTAVYSDALNRLADLLHYLNSSDDKSIETTRFWFDTRANLRREMEDRKRRFDDKTEVRTRIEEAAKKLFAGASLFDGVHVFTAQSDVPDDSALRARVAADGACFHQGRFSSGGRRGSGVPAVPWDATSAQNEPAAFHRGGQRGTESTQGRDACRLGLGEHRRRCKRRPLEHRSESASASGKRIPGGQRGDPARGARVLQMVALSGTGRSDGNQARHRSVSTEYDQRHAG